jgi:hypothetical protein
MNQTNETREINGQREQPAELLKPKDVALLLGISLDKAYRLFHSTGSGFPSFRIGKTGLYVARAKLMEFLGHNEES